MSPARKRRPFAYKTWAVARVAQEIRRIRPEVKPKPAAAAAIRYMSLCFEHDGEKALLIEYLPRVKKALQTLENKKLAVRSFEFFEAWCTVNEEANAAGIARMQEIMTKALDEERMLDEAEAKEYDALAAEVKAAPNHLGVQGAAEEAIRCYIDA